jgi:Ca-activated chloride channel homolog
MNNKCSIFAILILAAILMAYTESRTITGTVTDQGGQPLAGVSVNFKGGSARTATDINGNYKITPDHPEGVLVFMFPGFKKVEEKISEKTIINVIMTQEPVVMDEMVVAAYGSKKERAPKSCDMAAPASGGVNSGQQFQQYSNDFNTEGYASVNETGYKNVKNNPLSTFSIDVDNASYSNIRRFINMGEIPPADAVRTSTIIRSLRVSIHSLFHPNLPYVRGIRGTGCCMSDFRGKALINRPFRLQILSFLLMSPVR